MPSKLVLICCDPILHDLLVDRLKDEFDIVGSARNSSDCLRVVRSHASDVILLDTEQLQEDPATLVSKLAIVTMAPIVVLSAHAARGGANCSALLSAGALTIVPKAAGPLTLDLDGFGETLVSILTRAATQ